MDFQIIIDSINETQIAGTLLVSLIYSQRVAEYGPKWPDWAVWEAVVGTR